MASNESLNCRMYEEEYPEVDDLVVVQVKSIAEMGAYCSLLEYNNIEGMILMSELSRRRIRSVNKLIRVGRQEIVAVLRVNKEKGYIDLSKKRVSPEEVEKAEEKWNKSKAVHSIMRHVATNSKYGVEELYKRFGWPMAKKFGHAYDGLKYALQNKPAFLTEFDVPEDIRDELFRNIEKRLKPQVVTVRGDVEITCFTYEGIDAIKRALKIGLDQSTDDFPLKIKLVAPPLYAISVSTLDQKGGIAKVHDVINIMKETMTKSGGDLSIKNAPTVITTQQDQL